MFNLNCTVKCCLVEMPNTSIFPRKNVPSDYVEIGLWQNIAL